MAGIHTYRSEGVVAVVYALIIGLFVYRELTFQAIKNVLFLQRKQVQH